MRLSIAILFAACALSAGAALAQLQVDLNRPRSAFECDLPIGIQWYGSKQRCLQELCVGANVTNRWTFENQGKRRRKNPCYGVNPRTFGD